MSPLGIAVLLLHSGATALTGAPFGATALTGPPFGATALTGPPFGATAPTGAPFLRPATVRRSTASLVCLVELDPNQISVIAGAAAVLIGGGALGLQARQSKVVKQVEDALAAPAATMPSPPPPAPVFTPSYRGKVTVGLHRMAGRAKRPPPREQWVPPEGWKKPKKPVISWYDRGDRLTPTRVAAPPLPPPPPPPPAKQPNIFEQFFSQFGLGRGAASQAAAVDNVLEPKYTGKVTVGQHRMAGRAKPPPPREQWVPPTGWTPPSKVL
jgi:hypothetical protein